MGFAIPIVRGSRLANAGRTCLLAILCITSADGDSLRDRDYIRLPTVTGNPGGALIVSRRSEPRTLNPIVAMDATSNELIGLLHADLIHINRASQLTEAGLAKSWKVSPDGRVFTLYLRRGLRFSDGEPFDADDVLFTFRAYLDERNHSPHRDLLIVAGAPIAVRRIDQYTVVFTLRQPYAAAERLFDSIAILPRHVLEAVNQRGELSRAWTLASPPAQIVGLGPFQFVQYRPGQKLELRRNPFYWKVDRQGTPLPYLNSLVSVLSSTPEQEELRLQAGEVDIISRFDSQDFAVLQAGRRDLLDIRDVGPGLEYSFLLLNSNDPDASDSIDLRQKKDWFSRAEFRRAISFVIDREALVRLAYAGRAIPVNVPISSGNRRWVNGSIAAPSRSPSAAREALRSANFRWDSGGFLRSGDRIVEFSISYNAGRPQYERMVSLIQQDLKEIGIKVDAVPMDQASLIDRVFTRLNYEAAIMALADGDADPNAELNVIPSTGSSHVWNLRPNRALPAWQREVDTLMKAQMTAMDQIKRKALFDRVLFLLAREQPVVYLLSPHILAGAATRVGNFEPVVLNSYTLWNADQLFIRSSEAPSAVNP